MYLLRINRHILVIFNFINTMKYDLYNRYLIHIIFFRFLILHSRMQKNDVYRFKIKRIYRSSLLCNMFNFIYILWYYDFTMLCKIKLTFQTLMKVFPTMIIQIVKDVCDYPWITVVHMLQRCTKTTLNIEN